LEWSGNPSIAVIPEDRQVSAKAESLSPQRSRMYRAILSNPSSILSTSSA